MSIQNYVGREGKAVTFGSMMCNFRSRGKVAHRGKEGKSERLHATRCTLHATLGEL
jgi:hypothetical protein